MDDARSLRLEEMCEARRLARRAMGFTGAAIVVLPTLSVLLPALHPSNAALVAAIPWFPLLGLALAVMTHEPDRERLAHHVMPLQRVGPGALAGAVLLAPLGIVALLCAHVLACARELRAIRSELNAPATRQWKSREGGLALASTSGT